MQDDTTKALLALADALALTAETGWRFGSLSVGPAGELYTASFTADEARVIDGQLTVGRRTYKAEVDHGDLCWRAEFTTGTAKVRVYFTARLAD
jgi:hypothetical protein